MKSAKLILRGWVSKDEFESDEFFFFESDKFFDVTIGRVRSKL